MSNGIFRNIAELFSSTPPQQQQQQQPVQQAQQQGNTQMGIPDDKNGSPAPAQPQNNVDPMKSSLDDFTDVFKLAKENTDKAANPLEQPLFELDPAKFQERVGQMDFASGLQPELVQKALGGDVQAFVEVLNAVGRKSYAESVQLGTRLTEAGVNQRVTQLQSVLPTTLRSEQVRTHLAGNEQSAALLHPSIAPVLMQVQQQFEAAYPQASAADISKMVTNYFGTVAKQVAGGAPQPSQEQQRTSAGQDFSNFFG